MILVSRCASVLRVTLAVVVLLATAFAQQTSFQSTINSTQEVPPTGSPATGTGAVILDVAAHTVTFNITFAGLSSPEVAAHFHQGAVGANGPVIIPLPLGSPKIGTLPTTPAQEAAFLSGNVYINIHSVMFPGGEIRGQVLALPIVAVPIVIDQIDWDTAWMGSVPSSEYGHLQFSYTADPLAPHFCNIVARRGFTGADQWIVRNLFLPDAGSLGVSGTTICTNIDLRPLGVTLGTSSVGQPILYTVTASSLVPLSSMPVNALANTTVIGSRLYRFGAEESIVPVVPGYTPPSGPQNKIPWDGTTTLEIDWRRNLPNEEQGTNQCGPAGLANSFHWMENEYFPLVNLNGQTWVQTLTKLKLYTNWSAATGIGQRDAIEGKLLFGQDPGKVFIPGLIVKYEADGTLTDLGASVTAGTETANRHGPSMAPTFDWLLSELAHGEDVEVSIDWLDANGMKTGGHVASVAGAARFGNKLFVWTNDDALQGAKDAAGNPPANGGLRTNLFHQVTVENGGYMRFNGFGTNNRIKAVYSESLDTLAPSTEKCGNGDPLRIPCPCANNGSDPHAGCANSINPAGAALSSTGTVALDDVVLHSTGMSGGIAIFFRTDGRILGGVPFGDGITCTGGSLLRLRAVSFPSSITSIASFPVPPETITLSQRSGTFPGSGVRYQYGAFYRNAAAAFCPPATFNTTDTEEILW